jgi:PKD repeat protein
MVLKPGFIIIIALFLIGVSSAYSDYCAPPGDATIVLVDNVGSWVNVTIMTNLCYVCVDNGGGYGDVECTLCDNNPPVVSFTSNVTCGIIPFAVQFTDTSTGINITNWSWDFANGNSSLEDPINTYIATGMYGVDHNATNEFGTGWSNISGYITARAVGDTCIGGDAYDSDRYQSDWFWFVRGWI